MMERRSEIRYLAKQDLYTVRVSGSSKILGTIYDIGLNGLSFWYPPEALMIEETGKFDLIYKNQNVIFRNISYINKYDFEITESRKLRALGYRRRGVEFINKLESLDNFIFEDLPSNCSMAVG